MDTLLKNKLINEIQNIVGKKVDLSRDINDEIIREIITDVVFEKSKQFHLIAEEKVEIVQSVFDKMRGLDILESILKDNTVTEIMINGHENIFIERAGRLEKSNIVFESKEKLEDVIQKIVSSVNRVVNESNPICDARLIDGSRVSIVLDPVALNGPILTIRKFSEEPMTIKQLLDYGSITEEVADILNKMVVAKFNIFVCGGTGSGKTTFLNALSNFIPKDERIITIEDSAELQIVGVDNLVKLETRNANIEGKGEISIRDLIKTSLRMRPERVVVGEVRGAEAIDMLQAMNTGHDGSLSTGHANSTRDMLSRLETMVLMAAPLPLEAIRQQIASALDIIIHLSRLRDKSRRTMEICEVLGYQDGEIKLNPLYKFVEEGEDNGKVIGELKRTSNKMVNTWKFEKQGIKWN